ncbi:unnamed protein product [Onchocerca flexuosa]|uniref:Pectate lyase n=1 Tax=Onchocerca flexuosa TaxID=387005 RepID=A0A183HTF3_9BILA|nr:unnamed protein product [Onchocerca flexuosa]
MVVMVVADGNKGAIKVIVDGNKGVLVNEDGTAVVFKIARNSRGIKNIAKIGSYWCEFGGIRIAASQGGAICDCGKES